MATFSPTITVDVSSVKEATLRIAAYRTLFNFTGELLIYVRGVFVDNANDVCFLNQYANLVTVTSRSIKWFDPACGKEIVIKPYDPTFELIIAH